MLQVMGLATIVAIPVCFATPAHANDFYRPNYRSDRWNGFPLRGRVIINFPSQQRTTESTIILQVDRFGSSHTDQFRDLRNGDRFFGQQYNNEGRIHYDRFEGDRYGNDRQVKVIRIYNDRDSDPRFSLHIGKAAILKIDGSKVLLEIAALRLNIEL